MQTFTRNLIATGLIIVGIIIILANLELIDVSLSNVWHYIYPLLFMGFGVLYIIRYYKTLKSGWMFGSFLFVLGGLLLLDQWAVIHFAIEDVWKLWPLIIVYIGLSLLGKKQSHFKNHKQRKKYKKIDDPHKSFKVGKFNYNQQNWEVDDLFIEQAVGDFNFDFTKASIPEREITIELDSWAGKIHILLPEELPFSVEAEVGAGEIQVLDEVKDGVKRKLVYKSADYDKATKKINFKLQLKAGAVKIDQAIVTDSSSAM